MSLTALPAFAVVVAGAASAPILPGWNVRSLTVERQGQDEYRLDWRANRNSQGLNAIYVRVLMCDSPTALAKAVPKELTGRAYEDLSGKLPPATSGQIIRRGSAPIWARVVVYSGRRIDESDAKAVKAAADRAYNMAESLLKKKSPSPVAIVPALPSGSSLNSYSMQSVVISGSRQSASDGPALFAIEHKWAYGGGPGKPYMNAELYRFQRAADADRFLSQFGSGRRSKRATVAQLGSGSAWGYTDRRGLNVLRLYYWFNDKRSAENDPGADHICAQFFNALGIK